MNIYYITGTSRGLGKALAEGLLRDSASHVTGLARNNSIVHERYKHVEIDLADPQQVMDFQFGEHPGAASITLINNAGAVGPVKYAGKMTDANIARLYQVNLIAPSLLINAFIRSYTDHAATKNIINVSSGAGKNPIDGWSVYCATKAGIDMFSRTVNEELNLSGSKNFRIWSVAPGIVDTAMQEEIRNSDPGNFSRLSQFISYHSSSQLAQPDEVAKKYFRILESPSTFTEVVISVKDIDPDTPPKQP
ncbi:MAG: short-chain alcohol dehydrogenase/reductase [Bacteroidetes bacterium]|nr:MAG: short-chain alcohol dehydrogenase/reductase [Bacteroidota bacterium]